jgi:hypothetical protein
MKLPFTGGCACGAIRYEFSAEPIMMGKCHCRDCQHISGGAFVPFVIVPSEAFRLTRGKLQYHFTEGLKGGKPQAWLLRKLRFTLCAPRKRSTVTVC